MESAEANPVEKIEEEGGKKKKKQKKQAKQIDTRTKINLDEQMKMIDESIREIEMQSKMREVTTKMKKEMIELNMRMLLRVVIIFKNIGIFEGVDKSQLYGKDYTGNHIAIFECEMKTPPLLSKIDHDDTDFMNAYRINFLHWKLTDIDNFMGGNPYFREYEDPKVWESKFDGMIQVSQEM